jgi:hypothetical protein
VIFSSASEARCEDLVHFLAPLPLLACFLRREPDRPIEAAIRSGLKDRYLSQLLPDEFHGLLDVHNDSVRRKAERAAQTE